MNLAIDLAINLKVKLDAFRAEFFKKFPLDKAAIMQRATDDWTLPVPATFVIDQNQRIALAHIDIDYRNRLEPAHAIATVQRLSRQLTAV